VNIVRRIDEKLMRLLTVRWAWYRDFEKRHQDNTRAAILSTLIPALGTLDVIISGCNPLNMMFVLYWLVAFYEWRLWFRWRKIRAGSDK
jgi:hypothetical protein